METPQAEAKGNLVANYSHLEFVDSSPRSRGADGENSLTPVAREEAAPPLPLPPTSLSHCYGVHPAQRFKFMCSYGGRIQPRAHDNQLSYVGGDTKIVAVDRSIRYSQLHARLAMLTRAGAGNVFFKYQLPGEDLDALISVANDEDVEHMIVEYDRLQRSSIKPARLRLFLFLVGQVTSGLLSTESKTSDRQRFLEALNSVPIPSTPVNESLPPPGPPPASAIGNPDFLFGLENGIGTLPSPLMIHDPAPEVKVSADASPVDDGTPLATVADATMDDNWIAGGGEQSAVHKPEIQGRIQGLETLHSGSQQETSGAPHPNQQLLRERTDEENAPSGYSGEDSLSFPKPEVQVVQEKIPSRHIPVAYLQEVADAGVYCSFAGMDRAVYLFPSLTPQDVYSSTIAETPASKGSQAGLDCYPVTKPTLTQNAAPRNSTYVVSPPPAPQPSAKTIDPYAEKGLAEVSGAVSSLLPQQLLAAYDIAGRPLYYFRSGLQVGGRFMPVYQTQRATSAADAVKSAALAPASAPTLPQLLAPAATPAAAVASAPQVPNPEDKIAANPLQAS